MHHRGVDWRWQSGKSNKKFCEFWNSVHQLIAYADNSEHGYEKCNGFHGMASSKSYGYQLITLSAFVTLFILPASSLINAIFIHYSNQFILVTNYHLNFCERNSWWNNRKLWLEKSNGNMKLSSHNLTKKSFQFNGRKYCRCGWFKVDARHSHLTLLI